MSNVELDSPHCLFTAAMVCLSDARVSGGVDPEPFLQPIKALLSYLGMRWVAASRDPVVQTIYELTNSDRAILGKSRNSAEEI